MSDRDIHKEFEITSIARTDMEDYFTDEEINSLNDKDMIWIASKMADLYCDNGFWEDMDNVVRIVLEKKKQKG